MKALHNLSLTASGTTRGNVKNERIFDQEENIYKGRANVCVYVNYLCHGRNRHYFWCISSWYWQIRCSSSSSPSSSSSSSPLSDSLLAHHCGSLNRGADHCSVWCAEANGVQYVDWYWILITLTSWLSGRTRSAARSVLFGKKLISMRLDRKLWQGRGCDIIFSSLYLGFFFSLLLGLTDV